MNLSSQRLKSSHIAQAEVTCIRMSYYLTEDINGFSTSGNSPPQGIHTSILPKITSPSYACAKPWEARA
ncbi:MAG: hypothetical protein ABH871_05455 [Pseudomonadota bacterium]